MAEAKTITGERIETFLGRDAEGRAIIRTADGLIIHRKDETDWPRVDALSDADIEKSIADDPDWAEFRDVDWSKVKVTRFEPKKPISIRLDPDVLDFFKKEGPGYQGRINAVLRHFMAEKLKTG